MLHGAGEQGNGTSQLSNVRIHGPNYHIDNFSKNYPFVILTPQSPGWWSSTGLNNFITYALANYSVDPKRVYMTGLSMGGAGTIEYITAYPTRIAAAIPICPAWAGYSAAQAADVVTNDIAVWGAVALDDAVVGPNNLADFYKAIAVAQGSSGSYNVYTGYDWGSTVYTAYYNSGTFAYQWDFVGQNYQNAGVPFSPKRFFTLYPTGGHSIWNNMYSDDGIYTWLLLNAKP
jgi:predicted peptidase